MIVNRFDDLFEFTRKTGRPASFGAVVGTFPFFISSQKKILSTESSDREGPALIFGTGGNASVHYVDGPFSASNDCFIVVPKNGRAEDAKFYHHYLKTNSYLLEAGFRGASLKHISKSYLSSLPLPTVPDATKRRVVEILDKADGIRRKRAQVAELTDKLLKSIFLEMFGDPGQNPHRWPVMTIGDLAQSTQYGASAKAGADGEYPILRMNNLTYDGQVDFRDMKYIDLSSKEIDKYTVIRGDVLFNRTNSADLVGKTAVYQGEERLAFAGYLIRLRTNKHAVPDYISAFLNSSYGKATLRGMCRSIIGMANINAKELRSITIPVPPIALQRQYQQRLEAISKMSASFRNAINESEELFLSLSQRAFRGEL